MNGGIFFLIHNFITGVSRYELGAGEAVALTSQTLSVGESYTISVNRSVLRISVT